MLPEGARTGAAVSVILRFIHMRWRIPVLHVAREDWRITREELYAHLRLGLPFGFQTSIIALGTIAVQVRLNSLGADAVATYTTAARVDGLAVVVLQSLGLAVSMYAAQNLGARDFDRIRQDIRQGTVVVVIASVLMGGIILLAGETFVRPAVDTVTGAIPIVEPSTATGATTLIGPLTMTGSMPVLDSTTATGQMPLVGPTLATGAIPVVHAEGADDAAPSHDGPVPGAAGSGGVSALIAHGEFDPGILEDPVFEDEPVPGHAEPASNDSGEQEDSAATTGDAPPAERD